MKDQLPRRISAPRRLAGIALILVGLAGVAFGLELFRVAGAAGLQDGQRAVTNLWALAVFGALPLSAGVALARGRPGRRWLFGGWLVAAGSLVLALLWTFGPHYRDGVVAAIVGSVGCAVPLVIGGGILLLVAGRSG